MPCGLSAQTAGVFVDRNGWESVVVQRLYSAGLLAEGVSPGSGAHTTGMLHRSLINAVERDSADRPLPAWQLELWQQRLSSEQPRPIGWGISIAGSASVGFQARRDAHTTGFVTDSVTAEFAPGQVAPDTITVAVEGDVTATLGAMSAVVRLHEAAGEISTHTAYFAATAGPIGLWAGRRAVNFAMARQAGVILGGEVPLTGGGVWLDAPLRVPVLGLFTAESFLSQLDDTRGVEKAWLWATQLAATPLPGLQVRVARGTIVGSTDGRLPSARRLLDILVMDSGAPDAGGTWPDNTIVSAGGNYRTNAFGVPVRLYADWGAEDAAGAWWSMPGIVGGVHLPSIPFAQHADIGVEVSSFSSGADNADAHLDWYKHARIRNGWTDGQRPLGHELGGNGREIKIFGSIDTRRSTVSWHGLIRSRGPFNLFAPTRAGRSGGGTVTAIVRFSQSWQAKGSASLEAANDWAEWSARLFLRRQL